MRNHTEQMFKQSLYRKHFLSQAVTRLFGLIAVVITLVVSPCTQADSQKMTNPNNSGNTSEVNMASSHADHKYKINRAIQIQSYGQMVSGNGRQDDGDDFPFELLGLLGLTGLKGVKGALGLLNLLALPLLLFLLPLFLPLLLLPLVVLVLPLLLLFVPVPVIGGRNLQNKLDSVMVNLPQDINHVLDKINGSKLNNIWSQ